MRNIYPDQYWRKLSTNKQIMGTAGRYQVKGAKNGLMLNIGGSATTNYVFVVGME